MYRLRIPISWIKEKENKADTRRGRRRHGKIPVKPGRSITLTPGAQSTWIRPSPSPGAVSTAARRQQQVTASALLAPVYLAALPLHACWSTGRPDVRSAVLASYPCMLACYCLLGCAMCADAPTMGAGQGVRYGMASAGSQSSPGGIPVLHGQYFHLISGIQLICPFNVILLFLYILAVSPYCYFLKLPYPVSPYRCFVANNEISSISMEASYCC